MAWVENQEDAVQGHETEYQLSARRLRPLEHVDSGRVSFQQSPARPGKRVLDAADLLSLQRAAGNAATASQLGMTLSTDRTVRSDRAREEARSDPVVQGDWLDTAGDWLVSAGRGAWSVAEDLVGGTARTARGLNVFNPDELARIGAENERAVGLLVDLVRNRDALTTLSELLIEHFYERLPETRKAQVRAALARKGIVTTGYVVGRMLVGTAVAKAAIRRMVVRLAATQAFKQLALKVGMSGGAAATGIGLPVTLLMLQGVLERAARASRRLERQHPALHSALKARDLDMAWFLVEPAYDDLQQTFDVAMDQLSGAR